MNDRSSASHDCSSKSARATHDAGLFETTNPPIRRPIEKREGAVERGQRGRLDRKV